ncbi:MAG: acetyl-CoA carboxylase carboxyltransferase subunit beta [Candidatus Delongbacteria bacterium]|nr:acetyl-CoA carboxylase carboxyltransferase subunit beta [Candidatus Delongbacteria bacterium]
MDWFKRKDKTLEKQTRTVVPDGLWLKCPGCGEIIYRSEMERNFHVCDSCSHHFRIGADEYIRLLCDEDSFVEHFNEITSIDPLNFRDKQKYSERLKKAQKKSGLSEGIKTGRAVLNGRPLALGVMDFSFLGGSVGSALGERIGRLIALARERKLPLVIISSSGGMRMQEGALSLMQMAKASALLKEYSSIRLPFISILTDPTTGGTTASFAMLGDIILAEPGALIGFAGPNVIRNTIQQELPEGFQRSEFLLEHGFLDAIVPRRELKSTLDSLLTHLMETDENSADE